jgi:ABC-2 type transport system permease protein
VVLSGLVIIVVISSVSFGLASAISIGDSGQVATLLRAGLAYLPAELIFAGLALLLFGMFPRLFAISWGAYAVATFIAFLGPGLKLSHWILDLSPTTHAGNPPVGTVPAVSLAVMTVIACALLAAAFVGFRERNIPNN